MRQKLDRWIMGCVLEDEFKDTTKTCGTKMNALIKNKTKAQLANYLHACLFSPCPSTL